jgi:hypothetical protein
MDKPIKELTLEELDAATGAGGGDLSEMDQTQQLQLQMMMDRTSKLEQTISNILKQTSGTADQITRSLK